MKLATYKDGSRDGQLVVVSRDLSSAHYAAGIASRLQQVLDDWNFIAPQLQDLYETLNGGKARHAFAFDPQRCMAPLPRAFGCVLARRGEDDEPLAFERLGSDPLAGARDDVVLADAGPDARRIATPALAAITGDIAAASSAPEALEGVRLLILAQGWGHARVVPADGGTSTVEATRQDAPEPAAGPVVTPPIADEGTDRAPGPVSAMAFGPVAITPDELQVAWRDGRLAAVLQRRGVGRGLERFEGGPAIGLGEALEALARDHAVRAGAVVVSAWSDGAGAPPALLRAGDASRLTVVMDDHAEPFGSIEQTVTAPLGG